MKYTISVIILFCISNIFCYAQADLAIVNIYPLDRTVPGTYHFYLTAQNLGAAGSAYTIYWQLDNGAINNVTPTNPPSISAGPTIPMLLDDPGFTLTLSSVGIHTFKVWIKATSTNDINHANDTLTKTIKVYSYLPPKNIVLEIYKHKDCGPCYPAAEYEDSVLAFKPNYSIVNIFPFSVDGDLYNADGEQYQDSFSFPHPAPVFDRFKFPFYPDIQTSFFATSNSYFLQGLGLRDNDFQPIEVSFKQVTYDAATQLLKVKLQAQFYDTLQGDLRFNLYITEDSLLGYQALAPDPNNYYHKHVLRMMAGGTWGAQGSIPATVYTGNSEQYEFQVTVPASWNLSNVTLIGMVETYTGDKYNSNILNSCKASFAQTLSAQTIAFKPNITLYPIPAANKIFIDITDLPNANKGTPVCIYDVTSKIVIQKTISSGNNPIDISGIPAGIYTIRFMNGTYVGKFSKVIK